MSEKKLDSKINRRSITIESARLEELTSEHSLEDFRNRLDAQHIALEESVEGLFIEIYSATNNMIQAAAISSPVRAMLLGSLREKVSQIYRIASFKLKEARQHAPQYSKQWEELVSTVGSLFEGKKPITDAEGPVSREDGKRQQRFPKVLHHQPSEERLYPFTERDIGE